MRKHVCISAHPHSLPEITTPGCAHKLFRRCLDFSQFWTAILEKLWRRLSIKRELSRASETAIFSEKNMQTAAKIDP